MEMEPPVVAVRSHPLLFELPFERKRGHDAGNHFSILSIT
jgi:hypothetical protein